MFARRNRRKLEQDQAVSAATRQVSDMAKALTLPGHPMTPETVARAASMVAMEVVQTAMADGATPRECRVLVNLHQRVGRGLGAQFAPGGPGEGWVLSEDGQYYGPPGRQSSELEEFPPF